MVPVKTRAGGRGLLSVEETQLLAEPLFGEIFCIPYFEYLAEKGEQRRGE